MSTVQTCPDCMGRVDKQSPAFFEQELYEKPYHSDNNDEYEQGLDEDDEELNEQEHGLDEN